MELNEISLVTIVRNCKDNLAKLIEYHRPYFKEIVVIDQSSTDGTYELAQEKADVAVKRRAKGYCEPDRNYACSLASQPYVFLIDDDELLSEELLKTLPELIKTGADIFWFKRMNFVDGVDIADLLGNDFQCRMWKSGAVRWSDTMHQYPEGAINAKVFFIEAAINHYRTFEGLKKSNLKRNFVAQAKEQVEMQDRFVINVEKLLAEKKAKID